MFSNRIRFLPKANRLIRTLEARRAAGEPLLDLTESNPTRAGFEYDEAHILRALARPASLLHAPDPRGLPAARRAVAEYYRERGREVAEDSLFLASGTSEAYGWLFKLLADPGDEILVPKPGYPLLEVLTTLESLRLVHYPLRYAKPQGWTVDLERLRDTISTRTAAIVVVSPNNPTGSYLKQGELAFLQELCRRFELALIVDEVFSDYPAGSAADRTATTLREEALTFVLNGFSKILGLPQLKLSWIQVSGPEPLRRQAEERLEFIADAYLSVASPVQQAAAELLEGRDQIQARIRARLEANHRFLSERLAEIFQARPLRREGGWHAVLELTGETADEELAIRLLKQDGVLVHPGYFYDFPTERFLVLSLLAPEEVFRQGVVRLVRRLGSAD
jgi:aspartate/methionine/tyrosine aminotransferase